MSERRKFKMKLRIKPEFNPPKIGKCDEPGLLAEQEFSFKVNTKLSDAVIMIGIIEAEEEFMKKYIEVITEEVKNNYE